MHELGLCEGVLAVGLEAADGRSVKRVRVQAGRLLGVTEDSWQMCWELVSTATDAAGALMELSHIPVRLHCRSCGADGESGPVLTCSSCRGVEVDLLSGDELVVEEVELAGGEIVRNPRLVAPGGH